jgi:argininosuccinate lyase
MYCRRRLLEIRKLAIDAAQAFVDRAKPHLHDVMVAYTHVQHAQPVSVAFWLSHYSAHVIRDLDRLKQAYDCTDETPLGAGAISGTSFLTQDRHLTKRMLGFQKVQEHTLDGTSARDYFLQSLGAAATMNNHWSRLAEEFILWSSYEFRTVTLDDGFAMGSSMMPQKKNPGSLELMRGRAGRVTGILMAGDTMTKGFPSGYNRDFHEDKEIMVELFSLVARATEIVPALVTSTTFNLDRMAELPDYSFAAATELANFLVIKGTPFRQAHHVVGGLVGELSRAGENFKTNRPKCYEYIRNNGVEATDAEIDAVLEPKSVMESYNTLGGTGPKAVQAMLDNQDARLEELRAEYQADQDRVDSAYERSRALAREMREVQTSDEIAALVTKHGFDA